MKWIKDVRWAAHVTKCAFLEFSKGIYTERVFSFIRQYVVSFQQAKRLIPYALNVVI